MICHKNKNTHLKAGKKSRQSRVYHQFCRNWISSTVISVVYHHCESWYTFGDEIQQRNAVVDDIQPDDWWYAIAFAMDKKISFLRTRFFGGDGEDRTLDLLNAIQALSQYKQKRTPYRVHTWQYKSNQIKFSTFTWFDVVEQVDFSR